MKNTKCYKKQVSILISSMVMSASVLIKGGLLNSVVFGASDEPLKIGISIGTGKLPNIDVISGNDTKNKTITIGNITWIYTVENDEATVIKCNNSEGNLTIPSVVDGKCVTAIGNRAFNYCTSLKSITIPKSVVTIGDRAFFYCSMLESVDFLPGTESKIIGSRAFEACTKIKKITIPTNVTKIGVGAFFHCSGLELVEFLPGSKLEIMDDSAFCYCIGLREITIPASVVKIGECAFAFTSIEKITLPSSITEISGGAFSNCSNLKLVEFLPGSELKIMDNSEFCYCNGYFVIWYSDAEHTTKYESTKDAFDANKHGVAIYPVFSKI